MGHIYIHISATTCAYVNRTGDGTAAHITLAIMWSVSSPYSTLASFSWNRMIPSYGPYPYSIMMMMIWWRLNLHPCTMDRSKTILKWRMVIHTWTYTSKGMRLSSRTGRSGSAHCIQSLPSLYGYHTTHTWYPYTLNTNRSSRCAVDTCFWWFYFKSRRWWSKTHDAYRSSM